MPARLVFPEAAAMPFKAFWSKFTMSTSPLNLTDAAQPAAAETAAQPSRTRSAAAIIAIFGFILLGAVVAGDYYNSAYDLEQPVDVSWYQQQFSQIVSFFLGMFVTNAGMSTFGRK